MLKNEKGMSLVKWIITVIIALLVTMIVVVILTGENGLINQWKAKSNNNTNEYVIKVNDEV